MAQRLTPNKQKHAKRAAWAVAAVCAVLILALVLYDAYASKTPHEKSDVAMDTVVTAKVWGMRGNATAAAVLESIQSLEEKTLSRHTDTSAIAKINQGAGSVVTVDAFTVNLLAKLQWIARESGGAYDPTIGALADLWDIGGENERIPTQDELNAALSGTGYANIKLGADTVQISKGQTLDMGATGKGIACDTATEILTQHDVKSAVLSVGGSILLYGENPDGGDWNVGIRDPRGGTMDRLGTLALGGNVCVSTSGDYERFFERNGVRYHHILDPKTGQPADSGLMSVTVISENGLVSDALSTACFVLDFEQSLSLLKTFNAQAVFVHTDNRVSITQGLVGNFTLTAQGYTAHAMAETAGE